MSWLGLLQNHKAHDCAAPAHSVPIATQRSYQAHTECNWRLEVNWIYLLFIPIFHGILPNIFAKLSVQKGLDHVSTFSCILLTAKGLQQKSKTKRTLKLKSGSLDKLSWLVSMLHNCSQLGTKRIPFFFFSVYAPLSQGVLQLGKFCFILGGLVCP